LTVFLLILAIVFWLSGYFITARRMANTGLFSAERETIIAPPGWVYFLCGAPKNKDYPPGTMRVFAFQIQLAGILLLAFGFGDLIWNFSVRAYVIGLPLVALLVYMLTAYSAKKYTLKEQIKEPLKINQDPMTPTKITDDLSYAIVAGSINFYSEFGGSGGANLTIEFEELEAVIAVLQKIKDSRQPEPHPAEDENGGD